MTDFEQLKFNLQENNFPYFSDKELTQLLLMHNNDVKRASYEGCLIKSQDDSVKLGPINTVSNRQYWLMRARQFRSCRTGATCKRVDE